MAVPGIKIYQLEIMQQELDSAHVRTQIRRAVVAAAQTLVTTYFKEARAGRVWAYRTSKTTAPLPAVSVGTGKETTVQDGTNDDAQMRLLEVVVEIRADMAQDASYLEGNALDELDHLAKLLEIAIATDSTLAGLAFHAEIAGTETLPAEKEVGPKPLLVLRQTWACAYRTDPTDPSVVR